MQKLPWFFLAPWKVITKHLALNHSKQVYYLHHFQATALLNSHMIQECVVPVPEKKFNEIMRSNKPIELLPLLFLLCHTREADLKRSSVFHMTCLQRISVYLLYILAKNISSQELLRQCQLKDIWKPSFKNEDGDGSSMSFREYPTALQVWPSTWHQRDRERESDLEQLCGGQLR